MKLSQEKVWDKISRPWKEFRVKPLEEVKDFLKDKKGKVLDLGCGSGRNFVKFDGVIYGIDFSSEQVKHAKKYAEKAGIKAFVKKAKAEKLPFENNYFDFAICITVLHCIDSAKKRKQTLQSCSYTPMY